MGQLSIYGEIAKHIDNPNAARAVGTAIGSNPRGIFNSLSPRDTNRRQLWWLHVGTGKKTAIIGWELAKGGN